MSGQKCIVLLSEKSSGSSACQDFLVQFAGARTVNKTRHFQNETLYWTKAASILGMPQRKMLNSEVPISPKRAKRDLLALLQENVPGFKTGKGDDRRLIYEGWQRLAETFGPVFLEKSPHHLLQWSALELLIACRKHCPEIDIIFVGLVRNPMDTIYSQFRRWGLRPEALQEQWVAAYRNLRRLQKQIDERLVILRYEDMVRSVEVFNPILSLCGIKEMHADGDHFHARSISKWKRDKRFGFALSHQALELAESFGYARDDLHNETSTWWPIHREVDLVWINTRKHANRMLRLLTPSEGK